MLWICLSLVAALAAGFGSLAVLRRLSPARLGDPATALRELVGEATREPGRKCGKVSRRAQRLVRETLAEDSPEAALVRLEEFVSELRRELASTKPLPRVYARISLSAGTAAAVLAVAQAVGEPRLQITRAFVAFATGALGAVVSAHLGRRARVRAAAVAHAYDRLFARLEQAVIEAYPTWDPGKARVPHGFRGRRARRPRQSV